MSDVASMLFIYTETSLHAGSGTALGAVDLPIQRERMSGLPMVQGSGLKGALREQLRKPLGKIDPTPEHLWLTLFGHEPPKPGGAQEGGAAGADPKAAEQEMFAGALSVTDARLLLFPVRTVTGGWAWATCPMVLQRLMRDLDTAGIPGPAFGDKAPGWMTTPPGDGQSVVGTASTVLAGGALLIEDFEMTAKPEPSVDALADWLKDNAFPSMASYAAFRERLRGQLVVLGDTDFRFLTEHATEVVTRISIGETGTVERGALWSEEALPAEALLYSMLLFSDQRRKPEAKKGNAKNTPGGEAEEKARREYLAPDLQEELQKVIQGSEGGSTPTSRICLGGDRTTGRGLVGLRAAKGKGGA